MRGLQFRTFVLTRAASTAGLKSRLDRAGQSRHSLSLFQTRWTPDCSFGLCAACWQTLSLQARIKPDLCRSPEQLLSIWCALLVCLQKGEPGHSQHLHAQGPPHRAGSRLLHDHCILQLGSLDGDAVVVQRGSREGCRQPVLRWRSGLGGPDEPADVAHRVREVEPSHLQGRQWCQMPASRLLCEMSTS